MNGPAPNGTRTPAAAPIILPTRNAPNGTPGGCTRWAGVGCGAGVLVLIALILGSFLFFDRGVQWAVRRAAERIEARMDPEVPAGLRRRLHGELQELVRRSGEPGAGPGNGAFLQRAGKVLEDGRVTRKEAEALEAMLAAGSGGSGSPEGDRAP